VLDLLSLVAFNASSRVVHPTEAQVFRGPSRNGGTLLLDEIEALGRADKDTYAGLLAVLNSGFEQGGSVPRLEKTATGGFREVTFETYCPRAIAGIHKLADTLEDRSIIVVMQRKLAREKTERFSPTRLDSVAQTLRDRCYLLKNDR
jgi:putative DNA primase/helicase